MKTIYALVDPSTKSVRYIGATSQSLAYRLSGHVSDRFRLTNRCSEWIRRLVESGTKPEIKPLLRAEDWQRAEKMAISLFRKAGKELLNQTEGGFGHAGLKRSEETKRRQSLALQATYANDAKKSERRKELARAAGRSIESRSTASARMRAIWADPERADAMRAAMRAKWAIRKEKQGSL